MTFIIKKMEANLTVMLIALGLYQDKQKKNKLKLRVAYIKL